MAMANLVANLRLNTTAFANALVSVAGSTRRFASQVNNSVTAGFVNPARRSVLAFKDVSRVVSGIVIARVFYDGLQAIEGATSATMEFISALEYAQITYQNLFGDKELATEFINVLEDFAAKTPFSFTDSEAAAKRLLAYGIKYNNVMYAMQGIMGAASIQGDPTKIESISRAIGQIYTKGRIMNDEMRQLTEAGIPAYEILVEKLGVTQDQLRNLGKEYIPASKAINALIDGMTERFGNVSQAATLTMKGLISNIKDNLLMIGEEALSPVTRVVKVMLNSLGSGIAAAREKMDSSGLGGMFESIVPKEQQALLRTFLANLISLGKNVAATFASFGKALSPLFLGLIRVFNMLIPVINVVLSTLTALFTLLYKNREALRGLTSVLVTAAAAFLAFKIYALGALIVSKLTYVINGLSSALALLAVMILRHPIVAFSLTLIGIVAYLANAFDFLGEKIQSVFSKLSALTGLNPDKFLLPSQKERANDLGKFNNKLNDTADAMDDLSKKTDKANKSLLSFDEVFKLNDPDENEDVDYTGEDLGGISPEISMPEVPSFGDFASELYSNLAKAIVEKASKFKGLLGSMGLGALLGGLLGGLLLGPAGIKFGAIAGAIVGALWNSIADALGLSPPEKIGTLLGAGLGAAIGALVAGGLGAAVGGPIGALAGLLIGQIIEGISTGNWDSGKLSTNIGALIGSAIGAFAGGPLGMVIGGAIGTLVGNVGGLLYDGFANGNWDVSSLSTSLGPAIGMAIGTLVGGPIGTVVGGAIGTLVGSIGSLLYDGFANGNWDVSALTVSGGTAIGMAIGAIAGGPVGAAIGGAIGLLVGKIASWITENWEDVKAGFALWGEDIKEVFMTALMTVFNFDQTMALFDDMMSSFKAAFDGDSFLEIGANILLGIMQGFLGALSFITEPITDFFNAIVDGICEVFGIHSPATQMMSYGTNIIFGVLEGMISTLGSIPSYIAEVGLAIITAVGDWFVGIGSKVTTWLSGGATSIKTFATNSSATITTWASEAGSKVATWATSTGSRISGWVSTNYTRVADFSSRTSNRIGSWASETSGKVSNFVSNTSGKISTWASGAISNLSTFASSGISSIQLWYNTCSNSIRSFLSIDFKAWASDSLSTISSWASSFASTISSGFTSAYEGTKGFFSKGIDATVSLASDFMGHANGGVFNREHIANFAEGNKAEAIIPLENATAMQPFVDAVSTGLIQTLAPMMAGGSNNSDALQPLYVGTLIADDRSLKELERKMKIIRIKEDKR